MLYTDNLFEEAAEIEQYWTFNETSKYGTKTFKPQNKEQERLYWEHNDAEHTFIGFAFLAFILFMIFLLIVFGFLLCNYVFNTSKFNDIFLNSFYLWIILVLWFFYSMHLDDQKRFALRKRVQEEIPHN